MDPREPRRGAGGKGMNRLSKKSERRGLSPPPGPPGKARRLASLGQGSDLMAKDRSIVADFLVYMVVRLIVGVIQALPYRAALTLADCLAWLAYYVNARHRNVALDNLRHAFPGRFTEAELHRQVRA